MLFMKTETGDNFMRNGQILGNRIFADFHTLIVGRH